MIAIEFHSENSMRHSPATILIAIVLIFSHVDGALAADECTGPSGDCVAVGKWSFSVALGAGIRTNPVVHGSDIPLLVVPQFSYYGKHFFIENLDAGVTLVEGNTHTLSLIASPGYDRVFFYRSDLQNILIGGLPNAAGGASSGSVTSPPGQTGGPPSQPAQTPFPARSRQITYLAGPEWTFRHHGLSGQVDLLHEITGHNHGDEIRAALAVPVNESRNPLTVSLGLTWKSAAIVNYYYGAPNVYKGGSVVNPFLKLSFTHPLTRKWRLTVLAHYEFLGKAITDSPIISQSHVATAFAGATYGF